MLRYLQSYQSLCVCNHKGVEQPVCIQSHVWIYRLQGAQPSSISSRSQNEPAECGYSCNDSLSHVRNLSTITKVEVSKGSNTLNIPASYSLQILSEVISLSHISFPCGTYHSRHVKAVFVRV